MATDDLAIFNWMHTRSSSITSEDSIRAFESSLRRTYPYSDSIPISITLGELAEELQGDDTSTNLLKYGHKKSDTRGRNLGGRND